MPPIPPNGIQIGCTDRAIARNVSLINCSGGDGLAPIRADDIQIGGPDGAVLVEVSHHSIECLDSENVTLTGDGTASKGSR